ncbi:MAG: cobalamin-binding protein, partial [Rhodocyclaceae bacterium]
MTVAFALSTAANADLVVKDDTGQEIRLKAPAQRIVTLAPHAAESLFAAGAGDKLVGTVDYSDCPPAAKKLPRVGGYSRIVLDAVVALKPDLVLAWQSGNDMPPVDKLRAL